MVKSKWKCSDALNKCFEKATMAKLENLDNKEDEFKLNSIINDNARNSSTCKITVKVDNISFKMLSHKRSDDTNLIKNYSRSSRYDTKFVSRPYIEDVGSGISNNNIIGQTIILLEIINLL